MTNLSNTYKNKEVSIPSRSFKIGRNEPCPCGSGKKYKKCCFNIKPKQSLQYYYESITKETDEEKIYPILLKAEKDYPMEPALILPIAIYSIKNHLLDDAISHLEKAWQIMGTALNDDLISSLVYLFLENDKIFEAKEIIEKTLEKKESPELLAAYGEVKKSFGEFEEANHIIKNALIKYPNHIELIHFKMESLLDSDNTIEAFKLWHQYFDNLKIFKSSPVLEYLNNVLYENFDIPFTADDNQIKESIFKFLNIDDIWKDIYKFLAKGKEIEAKVTCEKIADLLPHKATLNITLLTNYLELKEYQKMIERAETIKKYHTDNLEFHKLYAKAFGETNNFVKAKETIDKAFQIALKDQEFKRWDVVGDYIRILLDMDNTSELLMLLEKINEIVPKEEKLLTILQMSLNFFDSPTYVEPLFQKLKEFKENPIINIKELYINIIFLLLLELDSEEIQNNINSTKTKENIRIEIEEAKNNDISNNSLLDYALLRIGEPTENKNIRKKMDQLLSHSSEYPQDVVAKYEAILKYGDPETLLKNPPDKDMLTEDGLNFYQLVAYIKTNQIDQAKKLINQKLLNNTLLNDNFLNTFELLKFIEKDKLIKIYSEIEMNKELIDFLKMQ
ncbi:MAG: SEC-C domain-containing protein [Halanaerobiales bacterium]|nr:SEC-C domain-containing protein [Halanaerobiales bacterium]